MKAPSNKKYTFIVKQLFGYNIVHFLAPKGYYQYLYKHINQGPHKSELVYSISARLSALLGCYVRFAQRSAEFRDNFLMSVFRASLQIHLQRT
jgi:hypothetical protein